MIVDVLDPLRKSNMIFTLSQERNNVSKVIVPNSYALITQKGPFLLRKINGINIKSFTWTTVNKKEIYKNQYCNLGGTPSTRNVLEVWPRVYVSSFFWLVNITNFAVDNFVILWNNLIEALVNDMKKCQKTYTYQSKPQICLFHQNKYNQSFT